jgi:SEC-C motif
LTDTTPPDYPDSLPHVYETAGRIPRTVDRHTYTPSGRCCVVVDEDWLVRVGEQPSFRAFLEEPVRNYFMSQTLVEAGQPWPFGARSHGVDGLVETYGEWCGTEDKAAVLRYLDCLRHEQIRGHWTCPCGSGEKLRKCHLEKVREIQTRISPRIAERALRRLIAAMKSESAR